MQCLFQNVGSLLLREDSPVFHQRVQIPIAAVLQNQVEVGSFLKESIETGDVGVGDEALQLDLLADLVDVALLHHHRLRDHLDGANKIGWFVHSQEHVPELPLSQLATQTEVIEGGRGIRRRLIL